MRDAFPWIAFSTRYLRRPVARLLVTAAPTFDWMAGGIFARFDPPARLSRRGHRRAGPADQAFMPGLFRVAPAAPLHQHDGCGPAWVLMRGAA